MEFYYIGDSLRAVTKSPFDGGTLEREIAAILHTLPAEMF